MCVISINVNEATLRDVRPELDSKSAIQVWAQQLIDFRIQEMEYENVENAGIAADLEISQRAMRREKALGQDMTPEELYAIISEEIDDIYANG